MSLQEREQIPADFYQPGNHVPETTVAFLIKAVQASIAQEAGLRLARYGLTHAQWRPLLKLAHSAKPMSVAALARELQMDVGGVTRMLDRLESKGFCQRVRSDRDRRVVHIELTAQGRQAARQAPALVSEVLNAHLRGFSSEEWQELVSSLRRMAANGEALRAARSP